MHTSKVGHIFVGETEWRLLAPKNAYRHFCTLLHKVGEIEPSYTFYPLGLDREKHFTKEVF
jgi:hypothetical protein